jgi:hypothetical protein
MTVEAVEKIVSISPVGVTATVCGVNDGIEFASLSFPHLTTRERFVLAAKRSRP